MVIFWKTLTETTTVKKLGHGIINEKLFLQIISYYIPLKGF